MKIEKLAGNSCGAPLNVPAGANYATCNHCSNQLSIQRNLDVAFKRQLDEFADKTERLSDQVASLTSQNEVVAFDRKWERAQQEFMVADKNGVKQLPTEGAVILGGIAAVVFGCIWIVMALGMTMGEPFRGPGVVFPFFGLVVIVVAVLSSVSTHSKAVNYRKAEARYKKRRKLAVCRP